MYFNDRTNSWKKSDIYFKDYKRRLIVIFEDYKWNTTTTSFYTGLTQQKTLPLVV